ncbi:condensin-2 complex subunit D3 [Caerostris extrusa]|uniref:Condensin-2 complex subunit D3 n=1 Tax=Caerostris extrusa TaxID=172846 RepID=A0AAV4U4E8_CAEEX|nr:condensin-2 complex subunit D3 [Caerostris extrusa]
MYLSPLPIISGILTRCDDTSPNVRSEALYVLFQHMKHILNVLMELRNSSNFRNKDFDEEEEIGNNEINGQHQSCWYNFSSFKDIIEKINNILQRHIEDNNGAAQKASLQALENIICFDDAYLTEKNLKLMLAYQEPNIIVREQKIQSLTSILETYPCHSKVQEYWIKGIFPIVYDSENTVQVEALNVIEEKLLWNILSASRNVRDTAFSLLEKLYRELSSHQCYLQKAFNHWHIEQKLSASLSCVMSKKKKNRNCYSICKRGNGASPEMVSILERTFGNGKDEVIWFYLHNFGKVCKLPSNICENVVAKLQNMDNWNRHSSIGNMLNIFGNIFSDLHSETLELVQGILKQKLECAFVPTEIVPIIIQLLYKTEKHLGRNDDFARVADKMMKDSIEILTPFISHKKEELAIKDLAVKSLAVIRGFCQIYPAFITQNLIELLKGFVFARQNKTMLPLDLCAYAFATLGVISLQDEALARELLPFFAKELTTTQEAVLREERKRKRMLIYKFMLSNIDPTVRGALINGMLQVLYSIAECVYPLNEVTESIVRDCLGILSSDEIRAIDAEKVVCEVEESEGKPIISTELEIRKLTLVEPVIPVMISLKNRVFGNRKRSTLFHDIIIFLKDILADFRNEVEKFLAGDEMLKMEVLYEIQKEKVEENARNDHKANCTSNNNE